MWCSISEELEQFDVDGLVAAGLDAMADDGVVPEFRTQWFANGFIDGLADCLTEDGYPGLASLVGVDHESDAELKIRALAAALYPHYQLMRTDAVKAGRLAAYTATGQGTGYWDAMQGLTPGQCNVDACNDVLDKFGMRLIGV